MLFGMISPKLLRGRPVPRSLLCVIFAVWTVCISSSVSCAESQQSSAPTLKVDGLGRGVAQLDGPWQFHLGDNPAWALPGVDDAAGHDGWEQLNADGPWGSQTHSNTDGYGWYRRHINLTLAPGAANDVALLIPAIDDCQRRAPRALSQWT